MISAQARVIFQNCLRETRLKNQLWLIQAVRYNYFFDRSYFYLLVKAVATLHRDPDSEFEGILWLIPSQLHWSHASLRSRYRTNTWK